MSTQARFPQGPVVDITSGFVTLEWQQWLQNPEFLTVQIDSPLPVASGGTGQATALPDALEMNGPFYPAMGVGEPQTIYGIWTSTGVPDNALGANGHFCFRGDGSGANVNIYKKVAGIWTGIA